MTSRLGTGKSLTFFYSVSVFPSLFFSEVLGRTNDMVTPPPPFLLAFYMTRGPKKQKLLMTIDSTVEGIYLKSPQFFPVVYLASNPGPIYQLLTAGMSPFLPLHVAARACLSQLTRYGGGDNTDDSNLARDSNFSFRRYVAANNSMILRRFRAGADPQDELLRGDLLPPLRPLCHCLLDQGTTDHRSEKFRSCPWTKYI